MAYRCSTCGYLARKWMGFCPDCGTAAPLEETASTPARASTAVTTTLGSLAQGEPMRILLGLDEIDRVLGGGVVTGSVILLGGEPGVGKSTLILQAAAARVRGGGRVLIATAEESARQVALRAHRLGVGNDLADLHIAAETELDRILGAAESVRPDLLIVDSVQAVSGSSGSAGSVAQVRENGSSLVRYAKESGTVVVLVGHVTKDGTLAGPKLLEHMVDVVLTLDGDHDQGLRSLRAMKNRFGSTHQVGLFEMAGSGLNEVLDPSKTFLAGWKGDSAGTVVFPAVEGRRSVTVEVQALTVPSNMPQPRRALRGVDNNRVHQILAVLQRHAGLGLTGCEVYVNVLGGWSIDEPACDLAIALAVASSMKDVPLGETAAWGEVGLTGEVRPVPHHLRRAEEAERIGVTRLIAPEPGRRSDLASALLSAGLR